MIKNLVLAAAFLVLLSTSIVAHDMQLSCDSDTSAISYTVRWSTDGIAWTIEDQGANNVFSLTVPDTGFIMVQLGIVTSHGTFWRADSGLWYNGDWDTRLTGAKVQ